MIEYSIKISGDALAALPRLKDAAGLGRAIATEMDQQNLLTISHAQKDYLSFPKDQPTTPLGLRCVSSRLYGSLAASKAVATAAGVESSIGSNEIYAMIHEFGFSRRQRVRPHLRRRVTTRTIFGRRRKVRGGDINVRTFTRQMNIPARAPIGHAIEDRLPNYGAAISSAIMDFWRAQGGGK